jgi:hypothetical protein
VDDVPGFSLDWKAVPRPFRPVVSRAAAAGAVALLAASLGCSALTPTTAVTTNAQYNTFVLAPGGSAVTTVTLTSTTTVGIALVSVVSSATGNPLNPSMTLTLGAPATSTTCTATNSQNTAPGFVAQIQTSLPAGTYCVGVHDTGLSETGAATIRINMSNGNPTNDPTPAAVDVFASTVGPSGSATHEIPIAFNGATSITLVSAGTTNSLGLAFGAWDGSVCRFSTIVNVAPGATPIATNVDPGNYCIKVFDIGTLTATILFTIDTLHP